MEKEDERETTETNEDKKGGSECSLLSCGDVGH
jgi:hypothetical protein